ncbi:Rne/Rng family ribonuclease [Actinokineospora sp. 24-640]
MSDMSNPAGQTGGAATTPALGDLPAKVRVHALAKLLGVSSREVLAALEVLGEPARGAQSSVAKDLALRVGAALSGEPVVSPDSPDSPDSVDSVDILDSADSAAEEEIATPVAPRLPAIPVFTAASPLFQAPDPTAAAPTRRPAKAKPEPEPEPEPDEPEDSTDQAGDDDSDDSAGRRRRRGRRGRGRGRGADDSPEAEDTESAEAETEQAETEAEQADADDDGGNKRRRRRRRRKGGDDADGADGPDDPPNTVVHVREARSERAERAEKPDTSRDEVRSVRGSTRLEAKRQRRRDGREAGRRRAPILSESEFLARREAVDRTMVVREFTDRIQIGVMEDGVLVEHFVTSAGSGSLVGNVYLGRVQNVLPSMEAAFVDIGRGRNAVLYAGEVDWDAAGLEGKARKIEQALSSGDSVLVQVTKDPVGHKGARLTTQISLPGRFLVYVPGGGATGISRKLPENERRRLKDVLKRIVPEDAGVIIRTASEGINETELGRDVSRLQAQWQVIKEKAGSGGRKSSGPTLLYEEPDLLVKVVRDLFTEDFTGLVVQGDSAWDVIDAYVRHVAPELLDRVRRHTGPKDVFAAHRIDEQLLKALDRKVWLPSGGYLVIDRTEAMSVIDVNTGKFTGSGGNLEETVTRNNLEAAEEIVRQLRLRDIGGIIVIDFIDMVLESNRDLVLRRLTECLGRDRTRHQVAEVTSLGLVQMTRKRVGTGLLEAFSTNCEHCKGRGVMVSTEPIVKAGQPAAQNGGGQGQAQAQTQSGGGGGKRSRNRGGEDKAKGGEDKAKDAPEKDVQPESIPVKATKAAKAVKSAVATIARSTVRAGEHDPDAAPSSEEAVADAVRDTVPTQQAGEHSSNGNGRAPEPAAAAPRRRATRRAASRPAGPPVSVDTED